MSETYQEGIGSWSARGLTLSAGNRTVTTQQLLEFAERAHKAFPGAVVKIDEFTLRVADMNVEGDTNAAPRLDYR